MTEARREVSADIPVPLGDKIAPEALASWSGFTVTGPDRETRVGEVVHANPASGGVQVTIRLDDGAAEDLGIAEPMPGWFFIHPRPAVEDAVGPYAAALNPWQRDEPCTECDKLGTRLVRVNTDRAVYDPAAYALRCPRHG